MTIGLIRVTIRTMAKAKSSKLGFAGLVRQKARKNLPRKQRTLLDDVMGDRELANDVQRRLQNRSVSLRKTHGAPVSGGLPGLGKRR
jgi:hypothetical protein